MTKKEKDAWRRTDVWKKIREHVRRINGRNCGFCGLPLPPRWECHHVNTEPYDNEDINNYAALCHACHKFISRFERVLKRDTMEKIKPGLYGMLKDVIGHFPKHQGDDEKLEAKIIEVFQGPKPMPRMMC